ncbi:unnamed protein product [Caenorhabditis bovis]|uniref:Phospholipid scramblase n=1 Tax=Caenorhabditis bovis TaxID=2654633 RepID=A0A8S1EWF1_9PELO|nr:unnamed protein product [Caenorhabditis bovis]
MVRKHQPGSRSRSRSPPRQQHHDGPQLASARGFHWMEPMTEIPGIPPGLEYIAQIEALILKQLVEPVEVLLGFETANRYAILNKYGQQIGFVTIGCCSSDLQIRDMTGRTVLYITRTGCCCCNNTFLVTDLRGVAIGKIHKNWGGLAKEMFTDADTFSISFPIDLDCKIKAVLLGASFLIVIIYLMISPIN